MITQAQEEIRDLMTQHITNSDRMNAFLAALASDSKYNLNQKQRIEIIKLFGVAAEIFEESLQSFVHKIVLYLQKILKENQEYLHYNVAQSVGKIVLHIINRIENVDELISLTNTILSIFFQNTQVPSVNLQSGAAVCID